MTTIIIESKSKAAQKMVEYLKTQSYAKIIEDQENDVPNSTTLKAIAEARAGKTIKCTSFENYKQKVK